LQTKVKNIRLRSIHMNNFVGIIGTNSDNSTNRMLLQFIQKHFADQANIDIYELRNLPAFNKPGNKQAPDDVQNLTDNIIETDRVILTTPRNNLSITAIRK